MSDAIAATPLWMDDAVLPEGGAEPLPQSVDVLIVGAGYTGLAAARETAGAGRSTLVLDGLGPGGGCSGRNGGQVAFSIKPSLAELAARHGAERAFRIHEEGKNAVDNLRRLAREGQLPCDWQENGCFVGAHSARHFAALVRTAENQPRGLEQRISIVPRALQREEIASDFYHGGCVYHEEASVDPLKLWLSLHQRAMQSGARVVHHCEVLSLTRSASGFEAQTARGTVRARQVLIATNGYSGPLSPWHRRRVIPIGSYQIATDRLGAERVLALIPRRRHISDTRRLVVYYRPSADGERMIFGGRAAIAEKDPLACAGTLRTMLTEIFPQLGGVRITHAWVGWVGYTFDTLPHLGADDGLYHSLGYCGQGVPLATYFGMRIGQQMLGLPQGQTALDGLPFPSRPYFRGRPWFLAPAVFAYRTLDKLGI